MRFRWSTEAATALLAGSLWRHQDDALDLWRELTEWRQLPLVRDGQPQAAPP